MSWRRREERKKRDDWKGGGEGREGRTQSTPRLRELVGGAVTMLCSLDITPLLLTIECRGVRR